ncbi:MAG: lipopolysaccharide biosynthesis protein [Deltaproteobacteria bacterium]|nr:lipopolysaccharide biosynthesis protein [Deltaproteobacteria bacterium]MBW1934466.1 lipopolysaccharide biosynthesis protein [Deltaproteobacteria bacterium]MBW1978058.1 lipopolysaccharide biosynthesis protein [Deltaproteobacteria bacterium]MBW2044877.1 lipopolysaccharide biosynthesis protein [Deltaproteobacteria bacterium]MBW2301246.1 lipopolysaccharide biosynthesis protein [Deltaproteobacteria bacterium]
MDNTSWMIMPIGEKEVPRGIRESPTKGITRSVVRGGLWVFGLRVLNRTLSLVRTVVLARLLLPKDFGLLGIALLSISTLETFSQTGFQTALIQKKEGVESYLDTAWTVSFIRGLFLFLILFSSAPIVANFFNSPDAILVIRVLALSFVLSGFRNVGIVFFQKELEFRKTFFYEFPSTVANLFVSIGLALILKSVWALVWGTLAAGFISLWMSYMLHPYRPKIRVEKQQVEGLFAFGRWVLASSILVFLNSQGDDIFVGKILGITALGYYQMAYLLSNLPATEITHIISRVSFPAYSKLQDDIAKMGRAYLRVVKITSFISIPLGGIVFILAPEFTKIFLGEKWIAIVPALQVLVIWGVLRSIGATTGPVLYAYGKPDLPAKLQLIQLIILATLIYPMSQRMGIEGTSISVVLAAILPNFVAFHKVIQVTKCRRNDFLREVLLPLSATAVAVLLVMVIKSSQTSVLTITVFSLLVLSFILGYVALIWIFERFLNYGIWPVVKDLTQTVMT